ncbi:hypothetical protein [Spirillospora sp. NPDC029432]|uniref:hypothetical protein n=1 Tax=Spirillospora sp. NPDC029432 TaxID=3154599 RepID=UPI0034532273
MRQPPTRDEIEAMFLGLLDGTVSRDEADRWAGQWRTAGEPNATDSAIWRALGLLHGIDLRHGRGQPYLHDQEQIADWLQEFRTAGTASGGGAPAPDDHFRAPDTGG